MNYRVHVPSGKISLSETLTLKQNSSTYTEEILVLAAGWSVSLWWELLRRFRRFCGGSQGAGIFSISLYLLYCLFFFLPFIFVFFLLFRILLMFCSIFASVVFVATASYRSFTVLLDVYFKNAQEDSKHLTIISGLCSVDPKVFLSVLALTLQKEINISNNFTVASPTTNLKQHLVAEISK